MMISAQSIRMLGPAAVALLLTAEAQITKPPETPRDPLSGTVGVCLQWSDDPDHVAKAVVVTPSGNPVLDASVPESVKQMNWPRPAKYEGIWVGVILKIADSTKEIPTPDCGPLYDDDLG